MLWCRGLIDEHDLNPHHHDPNYGPNLYQVNEQYVKLGRPEPDFDGIWMDLGFTSDGFGVMHRWHGIVGIVILE
jgi:hypothetical protein